MIGKLISLIVEYHSKWKHGVGDWKKGLAEHLIKNDFVEVVRCKDCKFHGTLKCPMWEMDRKLDNTLLIKDSFCSYGERNDT